MQPITTVAVTGATGFVGRHVVKALLAGGYRVRALVRDRSKATAVLPPDPKVAIVEGDVLDRRSPVELVAGCQACIHLVGIIREAARQTFQGMHVEATRAMVEACQGSDLPVKRFVHMSALGVRPDGPAEYQRTKFAGEQIVRRSGLDWTVFRPGLIHGRGGEFVDMVHKWCKGKAAPFFFVPYFTRLVEHDEGVIGARVSIESAKVAPVSVFDVAEAFVRSLGAGATIGEVYNLTGPDEMDWKTMLRAFQENLPGADTGLPIVGLPARPHAFMAAAAKRVGMGGLFPFDAGQARMAEEDATCDLDKVKADLGLQPRGFEAVLKQYAGALA